MTLGDLKSIIVDCCNDILFTYNGIKSGITSDVDEYIPTFRAWHGDCTKDYFSVDELLHDKFFSGKSLIELIDRVEFTFA